MEFKLTISRTRRTSDSFTVRWRDFGNDHKTTGDTGYMFASESEAQHMADYLTSCSFNCTYHVRKYEQWTGYEDDYNIQKYEQFKQKQVAMEGRNAGTD